MELDEILRQFEIASGNLNRLKKVWERAATIIPSDIVFGSHPEYDELTRQWNDLVAALSTLDSWKIDCSLPDLNDLAQDRFDARDIGEIGAFIAVEETAHEPARALGDYQHRLIRARRHAVGSRVQALMIDVEELLADLLPRFERNNEKIDDVAWS